MNFSTYRLTSLDQLEPYKEKLTPGGFFQFARRVYDRLFAMKPGETFDIEKKVSEENRDLFIKIACCYIIDGHSHILFNDTFTILKCYQSHIKSTQK